MQPIDGANVKLLNIAKAAGLAVLVASATACSKGDSTEQHLARANEFIATEKYKSAVIELKNALQQDNQSAEARYLLGKVYLESGDVLSAEKELQRAIELGWPGEDITPLLARALLAQGEYGRVRKLDETGLPSEAAAALLAAQSVAALSQGDSLDAEALANKALEKAPTSTEALLAKARVLSSRGDLAGADAAVEQVLSANPEYGPAWGMRGDILMAKRDYEGARTAYDRAIRFQPNDYNSLFKRALLALQLADYETAQADADALLKRAPRHPGANYVQGLIHYQGGRYKDAVTSLALAEPASNQYPLVLFFLGSAQLMEGNTAQAAAMAARFHNLAPDSVRGRKLLATIRLQQGNNDAVQELLRPVIDADPDDVDALNLMANALLRDGKTEEGITLLSKVAELQPDSPVAQVRLGAGLLMSGQGEDAAQHMETALEINPEFQQADILLVLNHLKSQDYPAAIEAAEAYRRRHLTSVTPYNLLGKVYQQAGQPDKAREAFENALSLDANDPAANHNLAQLAIADNDLATARKHYQTILEARPDFQPAFIQLAMLDAREGKEQAMLGHLEQALSADPKGIQPRLLLARYYLGKGRAEQVAPLFANLDKAQQQSPEVLRLMALAQLSSKDSEAAQFTLEQLLQSTPDTASVRHMMAMAAAGSGDQQRAEKELRRALELDENYVPSRIALARLTFNRGSSEEFAEHLAKLKTLAPDAPDVLLLEAAASHRQGDTAGAIALADKAFQVAPSSTTAIALANYKATGGDVDGALTVYNDWLQDHPDDLAVRMSTANTLQMYDREAEAARHYEEVLKADADNAVALNNVAWIVREQDPEKALEYARRASTIAPDSGEVLDTLAVIEYLNKDYKRASRTIERALKAVPDNPSIIYHSAMIAAADGDEATARNTLKSLIEAGKDFPESEEARALLAELED
jgi:putative PEP-CTERM system TPR-repeat lipoprotein